MVGTGIRLVGVEVQRGYKSTPGFDEGGSNPSDFNFASLSSHIYYQKASHVSLVLLEGSGTFFPGALTDAELVSQDQE